MVTVSANFDTAIKAASREIRGYLKFNGSTIFRGADGLISIEYKSTLYETELVSLGCAPSAYVTATLYNDGLSGVSLATSYFDAYVGVVESYAASKPVGSIEDDTAVVEYCSLGRFYITQIERNKYTTKVTAYDAMSKASGTYAPTVSAVGGVYAVSDIFTDILTQTGISGTAPVTAATIPAIVEGTCRDQLGWLLTVAEQNGSTFVINRTNSLTAIRPLTTASVYTMDDSVIYLDGVEDKEAFTINSIVLGTSDNQYTAGNGVGITRNNPYATQAIVDAVYADLHGVTFTPMKIHFRGDPRLETGDKVTVTTDGTTYTMIVMSQTLTFNGGLEATIECYGYSESEYVMSQSPTKVEIQRTKSTLAEMQQRIETAKGGIITEIYDADGYHTETIIANSMDLSTATSVWRFNINGMGHSNSYQGGTYNILLDDQGRLNASMILTGIIADVAGKNSWNLDTGALTITDGSINITTSNETLDIIQFNGSTSGSTYSAVMMPTEFTIQREDTSGTPKTGNIISIKNHSGNSFITAELDQYSIVDPTQISKKWIAEYGDKGFAVKHKNTSDVSATTRAAYWIDGATFYDSSGNVTASYPSTGLFKTLDLTPTLTSQYFQIQDAAITATTPIFVQNVYVSGGGYLNLTFTVQAASGYANVYVRQASGTIPDNTQIHVSVMIML